MFRFVKQIFISAMMFFGCNLSSLNTLKCVSIKSQECKARQNMVNVNSKEPVFFLTFIIRTSKCSSSCNNIKDPYAKLCVLGIVKNLNVKVFNLVSRIMKQGI